MHLVQIAGERGRRIALVEEPRLRCLREVESVYALVQRALREPRSLTHLAHSLATDELLDYDAIYAGRSSWRLLPPMDVPGQPARLLVSGTGLTHLGSARQRQAMHAAKPEQAAEPLTDSMRMFQWGVEGGRPEGNAVGIAPEWFHKGTGVLLRSPGEPLTIPAYAEDGGDEAEIAGIYLIGDDGQPCRVGFANGNEFSDHRFEKRNYLNLAGSKLRTCSIGPELVVGAGFQAVAGEVRVERGAATVWSREVASGEENMCHSLANLEHHHFKFEVHRQPGDVHVHFFGADALSFADGIRLEDGDWMQVGFQGMGRPLRNPVRVESGDTRRLTVRCLE